MGCVFILRINKEFFQKKSKVLDFPYLKSRTWDYDTRRQVNN